MMSFPNLGTTIMPFKRQSFWHGRVLVLAVTVLALAMTSSSLVAEATASATTESALEAPALAEGQRGTRPGGPGQQRPARPGATTNQEIPGAAIDLQPMPGLSPEGRRAHHKLDSVLDGLLDAFQEGGRAAAANYARANRLDWRGSRVLVRIDTGWPSREGRLEDASSRLLVDNLMVGLEEAGARIRRVWGPYIEARVPMTAFEDLLSNSTVRGIHKPWRAATSARSEGVAFIGADQWEGVFFRAPEGGLRVGVIDAGFEGYRDLLGRDLPPEERVITNSFVEDDDIEADDEHGTGVSEIVYDIVPEVSLYLANIETSGDLNSAITWMIDQEVHVISMSLGFFAAGAGNGTGPIVEIVERAPARNIPFVTSAGNQADRHWIGPFEDNDGDGFNNFAPNDESNAFRVSTGDEIDIYLSWDFDDYLSSSQDFDLLLINSSNQLVAASRARQQGIVGDWATEGISILAPRNDTYHIVVQRVSASLPETLQLHVFFNGLQYVEPEMSLTVPADGREVIAAGAVFQGNGRPEFFSSRGPTKDGRIKPDFGAPDGVSTETYGPVGFFGTSAAAPHTAGAIALLVGRLGLTNPMQTIEMLQARARDVGASGRDNVTGWGRLSVLPQ
jgi:subtilisin family serine protease